MLGLPILTDERKLITQEIQWCVPKVPGKAFPRAVRSAPLTITSVFLSTF